ncbi:phage tail spike protein, partial [Staphylococcus delphini]|uniref:phage tail spike protein n=1 Tax=Staphylococcus delphini TaxID=53344 RepID=UPI0015CDAFB6
MIHVMNFKGEIVDFISQSDNAVIQAVHNRNINERMETFDFTILSERTTHMHERNRIIIQDKNGQYREFIIDRISADIDGYTEVETVASYLEDITKARPYTPGKLEKMTTKQALSDVLKDTGWDVSDATEYGGLRTTSWTSYQTRYDVLLQLCTTYKMMADFYIEVGSNRVDKRLVVLRKRNPLFKGKEIEYGKDLTGLKRTVDFSEIKTALLCVGPEPEEGKKRVELVVKDDESQAKYGLPGRYNWGVYEPETEDQNMTESRLRTLGTTELNKRKSEVITYEVTAVDIEKEYKHEVINLGDMVRIKNRDFTPPLYVEAEVISEEYDLISKDVTYGFGTYKEFKESDLRSSFDRKLDAIREKLSDGLSNVNTIVRESLEGELQHFEPKILKGDTPPDNPVNDLLWLDTSNPKVAVLRRYWNGEWIKSSAENANDVGAITREQALYSELNNTFVNLTIQHSRLIHEVSDVLESEYLVDTDIKAEVNSKLNETIGVFNEIKQNLDGMTEETATIGALIDTQALFLQYREKMQTLYNTIENAKIAIDERFKLLQSQYTDEKFNEALNRV